MSPSLSGLRGSCTMLSLVVTAACGGSSSGGTGNTPVVTPASVTITPPGSPIVFGALGRTRQLAVVVLGTDNNPISSPAVTWQSSNTATATVNGSGLVTAVANGSTNITATIGALVSVPVVVGVTQLMTLITVSSPSGLVDSLRTATRTRLYTAVAKDSTGNAVAGQVFTWASTIPAVATVGAGTGLVTAGTTTGTTSIQATSGTILGAFPFALALFPATITVAPPSATLTFAGATQLFSGSAADSVGTPITTALFWVTRTPAVASISNGSGATTTASAVANGTSQIVFSAGSVRDSALVTVSGLPSSAPNTVAVTVGDNFFRSVNNNSANAAIDTLAVGGTVTWTWAGSGTHSVESLGSPSFASSTTKTSGTYARTFGVAGTYTYDCVIHGGSMTGTVIVR